jgi:hypothetical protein
MKIENYHKSYHKDSLIMASGGIIYKCVNHKGDEIRIQVVDKGNQQGTYIGYKREIISIEELIELAENNKISTRFYADANDKIAKKAYMALELMKLGKIMSLDIHLIAHTYAHDTSITDSYRDAGSMGQAWEIFEEDEELVVEGATRTVYLLVIKDKTYMLGPFENVQEVVADRII